VTAKRYRTDVALTVASGKMLCDDFKSVHELVTDLAGWPVMTHHMGSERLMGAVAAKVVAQVAWMPDAIENMPTWPKDPEAARAAIKAWLTRIVGSTEDTVALDPGEPLPYMSPFDGWERLGTSR